MKAITYLEAYKQCRDELFEIQNTVPLRIAKCLKAYRQEPPMGDNVVLLTGLVLEVSYYTRLWRRRERLAQKLAYRLEALLGEN